MAEKEVRLLTKITVAEFVILIASILANYAADDQKGNINCYRGPVHRNEGVETVLRDI